MEVRDTNSNIRPYQCKHEDCNRAYRSVYSLNQHVQKFHSKNAPAFSCLEVNCVKRFYTTSELKRHQRIHGPSFVMYICEEKDCGKVFSSPFRLKQHKRLHNGLALRCSYCTKLFSNRSDLKKHERVHSGEKPFKCKECGMAFKVAHHLREHERKHIDDRPHVCQVQGCTAKYRRAEALRKHMASQHLNLSRDEDLITFLNQLGINTVSDMMNNETLRLAMEQIKPNDNVLASIAAHTDICRCDPCLCDPTKPNSLCNCIMESDTSEVQVSIPKKSSCCSSAKEASNNNSYSETTASRNNDANPSSNADIHRVEDPARTLLNSGDKQSCCSNNFCTDGMGSVSNEECQIFGSTYPTGSWNADVDVSSISLRLEMEQGSEGFNKISPIETNPSYFRVVSVGVDASVAVKDCSTQYEDPTDLSDFDLSFLRSPMTNQVNDPWDLTVPTPAHSGTQTNPREISLCSLGEEEAPLDLSKKSYRDQACEVMNLDVTMLSSPVLPSNHLSDHEELNGMCSDGIQTTCCADSCTKPGILGLCNNDCDTLDSGCTGHSDFITPPKSCTEKGCCEPGSSCCTLQKHENNKCCIVVCLNDLENNLQQENIDSVGEF
ncbi:uncharacterized protein LOC136042925 [Artemia franciscana]|uniref:uncharacterized protein LOC136042925 n=1 Tax=Artemia franciscana TaxID=6661 RepID=UPI0032D9F248